MSQFAENYTEKLHQTNKIRIFAIEKYAENTSIAYATA